MTFFLKFATFNRIFIVSIVLIIILDILSFYGIYSNKFYFLKLDNYIFPILTILHIVYILKIKTNIKKERKTNLQVQNLEYAMYFIFLIYLYKFFEAIYVLFSVNNINDSLVPKTFIPIGIFMLISYLLLITCTLLVIELRKQLIGNFTDAIIGKDTYNDK